MQQTLQITSEVHLPIQKDARLLVRYKNVDKLSLVIHKLSQTQFEELNKTYRQEDQLAFINTLDRLTQWEQTLRNEGDYQIHSTEIVLPKLDNGRYLIFTKPNDDSNTFAFSTIQITNLAVVENTIDNKTVFQATALIFPLYSVF